MVDCGLIDVFISIAERFPDNDDITESVVSAFWNLSEYGLHAVGLKL